jgi:anthranilate phosphoribosyltransferase
VVGLEPTSSERAADFLGLVHEGHSLTTEQSAALMDAIFAGEVSDDQIAALLTSWHDHGETADEITGLAQSMLAHATRVSAPDGSIDIVGTGGDAKNAVNISTMAAFVAAGAGVSVIKHGSRASSSSVGSADVLEALGIKIDCAPVLVERSVQNAGWGFCFAQAFHPAMKAVAPVRKALGFRTVFNVLGPLVNPAQPPYLLLGVAEPSLIEPMATALWRSGVRRAWVVHSRDGFDEFSLSAPSDVCEVLGGSDGAPTLRHFVIDPVTHGFSPIDDDALDGSDAQGNARVLRDVLEGASGPVADTVVFNAAAALVIAGVAQDLDDGVIQARQAIESGAAVSVLDRVIQLTNAEAN